MENVLVPALVAAFVTLVIEYVAKPTLEARKERLLGRHRATQSLVKVLDRVLFQIERLRKVDDDLKDDARARLYDRLTDLNDTYADAGQLSLRPMPQRALAAFAAQAESLVRMRRQGMPDAEFDKQVLRDLDPFARVVARAVRLKPWHWRRRRRVLRDMRERPAGAGRSLE